MQSVLRRTSAAATSCAAADERLFDESFSAFLYFLSSARSWSSSASSAWFFPSRYAVFEPSLAH